MEALAKPPKQPEPVKRPPLPSLIRQNIRTAFGFNNDYNLALFIIFGGALMGFTIARLPFLDFHGVFCSNAINPTRHASPGECFYYLREYPSYERVGIIMHLGTILPAAFLVCFQFVPAIRHRAVLFHRLSGYMILILSLASTASVFMITRHAFGGSTTAQSGIGLLSLIFLGSLTLAYANIKRLQIEQHRAWMLRAWFYAGSIVTLRVIMFAAASIVSSIGGYYHAEPCDKLDNVMGGENKTMATYPECATFYSGINPSQHAAVRASTTGRPENIMAALNLNFGAALWLAIALHAAGVEIYLRLTPAEAERLRHVSYQRQLEAGMKYPGRAGLTVDRVGDSEEWRPRPNTRSATESGSGRSRGRNVSESRSERRSEVSGTKTEAIRAKSGGSRGSGSEQRQAV